MPLNEPLLNAVPFASQGDKNIIPIDPSLDPDPVAQAAASFKLGFPPKTRIKISLGGVPPSGRDMNGILNFLSQHQVWLNAGGTYKFNADLAAALGGYQKGAILASNDGLRLYVSTVDGNTTDFNTDMTGWKMIGTSELQTLLDTLQTNINNEVAARISSDEFLNTKIDTKLDKTGGAITGNLSITGELYTNSQWLGVHSIDGPAAHTTLPNGFIMQFGFIDYNDMIPFSGSSTGERYFGLNFPRAFPVACMSVQVTMCLTAVDQNNDTWAQVAPPTRFGVAVMSQTPDPDAGTYKAFRGIYWQAIGF